MTKVLTGVLALACCATLGAAELTEQTIVAMERRAMDGWLRGSPDELLEISDPEITYFHSTPATRLVGLAAVKALFEGYRGQPLFDGYELVDPKVVVSGSVAVLTYELATRNGSLARRWHATEVYREGPAGWRIIHSHFSLAATTP